MRLRVPQILDSNEARERLKSSFHALWMMWVTDERSYIAISHHNFAEQHHSQLTCS